MSKSYIIQRSLKEFVQVKITFFSEQRQGTATLLPTPNLRGYKIFMLKSADHEGMFGALEEHNGQPPPPPPPARL